MRMVSVCDETSDSVGLCMTDSISSLHLTAKEESGRGACTGRV